MADSEKKSAAKPSGKKSPKNSKQSKKDFLVVGLGASAGGVKAFQEFFASMPPNSGMAFVVILHLSPQHESALPQILQAQTTMPVIQVNETHKVEPNHVYVIPPNSQLEMFDGMIRCAPPNRKVGTRVAIDVFFRTLAEAYERNAVCIVLSGTGSDGTLGLKRIKESNGFAIVQLPEDAEHDQMPRSAIATGLADWILPIRRMPEKLVSFRASSERLQLTSGAGAEDVAKEINAEDSLREILTILRVRTGHDFTNYKKPTLIRRIARHLQIHELEDIPTYLNFLRDNPDEIQFLLRNLLINVTNFFRDREAFNALGRDVIPKLFEGKTSRDTIRIWTAGCASGEEAYSMAMLLAEYAEKLTDPPKFQVFATDVDDEAITQAREHHYPEAIEADVSPERLKRFFTRDGSEYRIKKELRETILFAPHNILRDPPFSKLDLITCRNLLIYLNREAQDRVMEIFHFALLQNGYLFLGTSETAEGVPELFEAIDKKYRIYQRRAAPHTYNAPPKLPVSGNWQANLPDVRKIAERVKSFSLGEVHYKLLENFAPPSVLVNQDFDVVYMSESVGRYLRFTGGEPSSNLLRLVKPDLLPDLRAALFTAQRDKQSSEFLRVRAKIGNVDTFVNLSVRVVDVENYGSDFLLVIFDEADETKPLPAPRKAAEEKTKNLQGKQDAMTTVVERLEDELQRTKANLRATIEQHEVSIEELKASNEELQAINEELRSASEELETSKEELQSVNEELTTVNHELKEKIDKTTRANSDLQNLIISTDIATIFLDRSLRIKRYAPLIEQLFNIKPSDIGRPLEHFTHHLNYENLVADAEQVLRTLKTVEREISNKTGKRFLTRFSPYRTIDDRINGVVLNFIDITERKQAEETVAADLRDTQILHELATRLVSEENAQTVYSEILRAAIDITDSDAGTVQIYDADAKELVLIATSGFEKKMTDYFHRVNAASRTACGIALKAGKRTFVDFDENDRDKACRMHVEADYRSAQSTPLVARSGRPIGMLNTHWHDSKHRPTERELRFLDLLARQAADLIEQRHAEEKLRRAAEINAFRVEIGDALRSLADPVDIQESVTQTAMKFFNADRCYYCEAENGKAIIRRDARRDDLPSVAGEYSLESLPLFKLTMNSGRPLVVEDSRLTDLMDDELKQLCAEMQIISFINVPIIKDGEYIGNLCITNDTPRTWAKSEVELAEELAERTWAAIERARAEEALRESEAKYRTLFDSIDEGFCSVEVLFDEQGKAVDYRFLQVNPAFERQTGIKNAVGRRMREIAPQHEEHWFDVYGQVARTGENARFERLAEQLGRWYDVFAFRIDDPLLHRIGILFNDVTERKRTEELLRQSEERLRIAIEASNLATWIWDLRTNEVFWNEKHFKLLGLESRENPQSPDLFFAHVHPEDRDSVSKRLQKALKSRTTFTAEFRTVRENGEIRWMEGYGNVIETEGKQPVRMSGVMSDITERKRIEINLRESQARLELLMESVKDFAIMTTDLTGKVVDWNAGAENIFGWKAEEIIGKPTDLIYTPEDVAANMPEKEREIARRKGRAADERFHLHKNGTRFYVSGMMSPLRDGELEGYVKVARDETAKMRAEKDRQEKETLRRLIAGQENERRRIARDIHDHFGQQLTALRLKLDTIRKANADRKIVVEIEEAQKIARNLDADVDFIAWELRPAALDDLGLLITVQNFVREWSHHTGIEAEFHSTGLKRASFSFETETNLYRIAQEALNNIYKHAKAAKVSVLLEKRKDNIVLIVEDDGKGFNVKDKTNSQKGIGLSGMLERVKILGGDFDIESQKGKGTTVYARIPLVKNTQKE